MIGKRSRKHRKRRSDCLIPSQALQRSRCGYEDRMAEVQHEAPSASKDVGSIASAELAIEIF